jgi:hypothetical protein
MCDVRRSGKPISFAPGTVPHIDPCMVQLTKTYTTMENKAYIGHGTKHSNFDIIDVVLELSKIEEHIFEYEGKRYLKFSVAARKEKSQYGATHTVYVRPKQEESPAVAEPAKPRRRKKQTA